MLDERLVGYWSDKEVYPGGMEAADIAFRPDGTGWVYWYNAARGFGVTSFTWRATASGHVAFTLGETASGTWQFVGGVLSHEVRSREAGEKQLTVAYRLTPAPPGTARPAALLEFSQPIIRGVTDRRFAFERELPENEHSPASSPQEPPARG
jgi:hypothetical protein